MHRLRFRLALCALFLLAPLVAGAEPDPDRWAVAPPLFRLAKHNSDDPAVLLDPCVVKHDGKWHLFAGGPAGVMYYQLEGFKADGPVVRGKKLSLTGLAVPQVYFHRASKKWHMIGQQSYKDDEGKNRQAPVISMSDKLDDPDGWSKPARMEVAVPLDEKEKPVGWMDFYVIFDGDKAHMFATSAGRLWRTETKAADFPRGWVKPVVALKGNIVYASHTYRQETDKGPRFITTLTSSAPDQVSKKNRQFQVSYVAQKLDGEWSPELVKWDDPFVGFGNARIDDVRWSRDIVHGEPLREGTDERMILEREPTRFVFHAKAKLKDAEGSPSIDCVGVFERKK
jgi:endo-1,4-beta-xylanase